MRSVLAPYCLRPPLTGDDQRTLICAHPNSYHPQETIDLLRDQFAALDADGSGALDDDDIKLLTEACEELEQAEAEKAQAEGAPRSPRR